MSLRWMVAALLTALVVGLWAAPASAAKQWSPLMASFDGKHWSNDLSRPLFRGKITMVPGQREVRTLYVRNQGPTNARLTVKVLLHDPSGWTATKNFLLAVGHSGTWTRVTSSGRTAAHFRVPQGAVDTVQVRLIGRPQGSWDPFRSFDFVLQLRLTHLGKVTLP